MGKLKNKTLLGFILGAIIFGGLGVVVAEYALKASDVEFTKSGTTISVQTAIEDLYDKANKLQTITIKDEVANKNYQKQMILTPENDSLVGIVYFNPANLNDICGPGNTKVNQDKSGCMKWYVYDKSDAQYGLLLDHNLTWGTKFQEIQIDQNNLVNVSGWKVIPELISGEDVAKITGNDKLEIGQWDRIDMDKYYYFDTLTQTSDANKGLGTSKYYWLFDYTNGCTSNGCKIADVSDSDHYGYWTSSNRCEDEDDTSCLVAWRVKYDGSIDSRDSSNNINYGLRPVITISK